MGASNAVTGYWYIVFPVLALLVYAVFRWRGTEQGRAALDRIKLRLPVQNRRRRAEAGAGALVTHLLRRGQRGSADPAGDPDHRRNLGQHRRRAGDGGRLRLGQTRRLDRRSDRRATRSSRRWSSNMVAVGEETGQMEDMLTKIADFYEAEVDAKVKALTSLVEPILIVFIGGVVGFIVISMYLPIFSIYEKIR